MANMSTLYNKSKFLKNIENNTRPDAAQRRKVEMKTVTYVKDNVNFKANSVKSISHNLNTRDVAVKIFNKDGVEVKGKMDIIVRTGLILQQRNRLTAPG